MRNSVESYLLTGYSLPRLEEREAAAVAGATSCPLWLLVFGLSVSRSCLEFANNGEKRECEGCCRYKRHEQART